MYQAFNHGTRGAKTVRLLDIAKSRTGVRQQQTGAATRTSSADALGLENKRLEAAGGADVRGRSTRQPGADDDDIERVVASQTWIVRNARGGKSIDPG